LQSLAEGIHGLVDSPETVTQYFGPEFKEKSESYEDYNENWVTERWWEREDSYGAGRVYELVDALKAMEAQLYNDLLDMNEVEKVVVDGEDYYVLDFLGLDSGDRGISGAAFATVSRGGFGA
jgi:hypothetical protein